MEEMGFATDCGASPIASCLFGGRLTRTAVANPTASTRAILSSVLMHFWFSIRMLSVSSQNASERTCQFELISLLNSATDFAFHKYRAGNGPPSESQHPWLIAFRAESNSTVEPSTIQRNEHSNLC